MLSGRDAGLAELPPTARGLPCGCGDGNQSQESEFPPGGNSSRHSGKLRSLPGWRVARLKRLGKRRYGPGETVRVRLPREQATGREGREAEEKALKDACRPWRRSGRGAGQKGMELAGHGYRRGGGDRLEPLAGWGCERRRGEVLIEGGVF